ncbi:hypothetical protein, partial [Clostridium perfringens]|uniref:hypothetical protein n=1 Tax=Clostridium perfringens TaxID=1502 RepID=UPI0037552E56
AAAVQAVLPTTVTGTYGISGTVTDIPVSSWTNTDSYTDGTTAGSYTFTAVLGVKAGVDYNSHTATVEVTVASPTAAGFTITSGTITTEGSTN